MKRKSSIIYDSFDDRTDWEEVRKAVMSNTPETCSLHGVYYFEEMCGLVADILKHDSGYARRAAKLIIDEFIEDTQQLEREQNLYDLLERFREYDTAFPDQYYVMFPVIQTWQGWRRGEPQLAESLTECYQILPKGYDMRVKEHRKRLNIELIHHDGTNSHYIFQLRHKFIKNTDPFIDAVGKRLEVDKEFLHLLAYPAKDRDVETAVAIFMRKHCSDVCFSQVLLNLKG